MTAWQADLAGCLQGCLDTLRFLLTQPGVPLQKDGCAACPRLPISAASLPSLLHGLPAGHCLFLREDVSRFAVALSS